MRNKKYDILFNGVEFSSNLLFNFIQLNEKSFKVFKINFQNIYNENFNMSLERFNELCHSFKNDEFNRFIFIKTIQKELGVNYLVAVNIYSQIRELVKSY